MSDNVDEFLAHYGVPGMKWGKRKASSTIAEGLGLSKGKTPLDKEGNVKKPSYARELVLGSWANSKKRYTDPKARATRVAAGKLAAASLVTGLGATALSAIAGSAKNPSVASGAAITAQLFGKSASITGGAAGIAGLVSVRQERVARAKSGN